MFVLFAKVEAFSFFTMKLLIRFKGKKKDLLFLLSTLILLEASHLMVEIITHRRSENANKKLVIFG